MGRLILIETSVHEDRPHPNPSPEGEGLKGYHDQPYAAGSIAWIAAIRVVSPSSAAFTLSRSVSSPG